MKRILFNTLMIIFMLTSRVFSQVPNAFNYQAVVRDASGNVITNKSVSFRISILSGSLEGEILYSETHIAVTNQFGLVNLKIGMGENKTGIFSPGGWGITSNYLKMEFDISGGESYVHMGTSQILSVPYAFHSQTVAEDKTEDADSNPENELQQISLNGSSLTLSQNGGTVTLPVSGTGGDNWGTQVIQSDGTLSGDGTVESPLGVNHAEVLPEWSNIQGRPEDFSDNVDDVDDADNDASNEIQSLNIVGSELSISNGNTVILPVGEGGDNWGTQTVQSDETLTGNGTDSSPLAVVGDLTDNQTLLVSGHQLSISSGNSVTLPDETEDADSNPENELQTLLVSGNELSISDGNTVSLPEGFKTPWQNDGNNIYFSEGKVGVGKIPGTDLRQFQSITGNMQAVSALNNSGSYAALFAQNEGSGPAADFRNRIRILDGSQGAGKVLTSDSNGLTTWEEPSVGRIWQYNNTSIFYNGGNVGIGVDNPSSRLHVYNDEHSQIRITSRDQDALLYLEKGITHRYASVIFREGTATKFYIGLLTNNDFWISTSSLNINGLGISANGDVKFSDNLDIDGQIKIRGGGPSSGYVLSCDNTGLADWVPNNDNDWTKSGSNMYSAVSGNVGIGTSSPSYKLDVFGNSRIRLRDPDGDWIALRTDGSTDFLDISYSGGNLAVQGSANGENIVLNPSRSSKVGIRTWTPVYDLDVNGNIRATGSVYYGGTNGSTNGTAYSKPDFVFKTSYDFLSTDEVEKFLTNERHLPWVTSARKEKEENGNATDMTRMAFETLEAVENLQLQIISMKDEIDKLKIENKSIKNTNLLLNKKIQKLESRH